MLAFQGLKLPIFIPLNSKDIISSSLSSENRSYDTSAADSRIPEQLRTLCHATAEAACAHSAQEQVNDSPAIMQARSVTCRLRRLVTSLPDAEQQAALHELQ